MRIIRLLLLGLIAVTAPVYAADWPLPSAPHIVVTGQGKIEAVPDIINLSMDINNTADHYAAAKDTVDRVVGKAVQAALAHGVQEANINASKVQATPQYDWQDGNRVYKGEQVSRQITMVLTQADQYNDLVNALLASGISRLGAVTFTFSQQSQLETQALQNALDNAKQKAQTIASHLGITLGPVIEVAPVGQAAYPRAGMLSVARADESVALNPGKQPIKQQVRVVFLLGDASHQTNNPGKAHRTVGAGHH